MYKTPPIILLAISSILFEFIVQAIIVERNLYTYYRLPTTTVKTSNDSEEYYILQCPFKSSMNIPKPEDMPVCLIVGRHSENVEKQKDLTKSKPRTTLNTQVDYRYLKPTNFVKLVKIKNGIPYTMLLKPVNKKEMTYKIPKTLFKEQYKVPNIKFMLTNPKTAYLNQSTVLYSVPLIQKIQINDSLGLSSSKQPLQLSQTVKPPTTSLATDFPDDDPFDDQDTQASTLKYLGVQDTLKKLQQQTQISPPSPATTNQTQYKSEKIFADLENYKKGFRTKGFQNMYHRDELYQDHIFYDDLQQMGKYRTKEKLMDKQP